MRIGADMADWLAEEGRHRDGLRSAGEIAHAWLAGPFVTRIRSDLAALPVREVDAIVDLACGWVADVGPVADLVQTLVAGADADPFFRPVFSPFFSEVSTGLMIYDEPGIAVSLAVTDADALAAKKVGRKGGASINFIGYRGIYHFIGAGGATFSFWEAPDDHSPDGECRLVGRRRLEDGETFVMDGRRESFVIEHASAPILYLHATVADDSASVSVEYDSVTRQRIGMSGNDDRAARIEMMTSLLRVMDRRDAVPTFERLLDGASFHARWHIMREMLALDAEAALPALRRLATSDPHPEVQRAARQTLDKFFPDVGRAA